jgi:hypothetical protein
MSKYTKTIVQGAKQKIAVYAIDNSNTVFKIVPHNSLDKFNQRELENYINEMKQR